MNLKCSCVNGFCDIFQVLVIVDQVILYYFDTYEDAIKKVDEVKNTGCFSTIDLNIICRLEEVINFGKGEE